MCCHFGEMKFIYYCVLCFRERWIERLSACTYVATHFRLSPPPIPSRVVEYIGNKSVPKTRPIIIDTKLYFLKLQSAFCRFQTITVSECCLIELLPCIVFEKNAFVLQRWKWPAEGTGTVPIVSAHFRSLYNRVLYFREKWTEWLPACTYVATHFVFFLHRACRVEYSRILRGGEIARQISARYWRRGHDMGHNDVTTATRPPRFPATARRYTQLTSGRRMNEIAAAVVVADVLTSALFIRCKQVSKHPFPGLPGWAGTRKVKPIWILLKQETVSGNGISWAVCKSAPRSRQITTPAPRRSSFFTGRMPFLPPNQQRQSTEGKPYLFAAAHQNCIPASVGNLSVLMCPIHSADVTHSDRQRCLTLVSARSPVGSGRYLRYRLGPRLSVY